jgi:Carboxypeptidase regulatory-like domain
VSGKPRSNERPALTNFFTHKLSSSCPAAKTRLKLGIAILLLACAFLQPVATFAFGNSGGGISGTVKDPANRLVANASVDVREVTTNLLYTTHTNAQGHYSLPVLPVGHYTISVHAPGFADYRRTEVTLDTDDALTIDASLLLATGNETVTVTDSPAHIDPDNTQLGEVISGHQMTAVPLNGRSFTDLLSLQAGVAPISTITNQTVQDVGAAALSPSGDLNPGTISINGQREFANAFLVNGADTEEDVNSGTTIIPNLDSIAEFRILTANFDAQYGGFSGGQIKVITKSGSNAFHGNVFEFLRNTSLDARNYFSPDRGEFKQNQFGGTFGGPIHKDRAFFFVDYQGTRQTLGVDTGLIPVPSNQDRTGNLIDSASTLTSTVTGPYFASVLSQKLGYTVTAGEPYYVPGCTSPTQCVLPNAVIPQNAFSLPSQNLLQYIPTANIGTNSFSTSSATQQLRDDKGAIRTDVKTPWGELSAYYFLDDYSLDNPYPVAQSGASVPGFNALNNGRAQLLSFGLATIFNESTINEAHLSYMRANNDLGQPVGGLGVSLTSQGFVDAAGQSTIVPLAPDRVGVENIIFNNYSIGTAANELKQVNNTYQGSEDFTKVIGAHTMRAGVTFHHDEVNVDPIAQFNGNFQFGGTETGSDFADFLLGAPTAYNQSQLNPFYGRNNYIGAYVQDSWHAAPSLVLNYGLRSDHIAPWREKYNQISTFVPGEQSIVFPNAPPGILYPGDPGVTSSLAPPGNEFSPRLGLSYTPAGSDVSWLNKFLGAPGSTTFRVGFGSFYTAYEALSLGVLAANPPYGNTYTSPAPPLFQNPFISAGDGTNFGQPFPLQLASLNASPSNPNPIHFGQFLPLSGIPAFSIKNRVPYIEEYTASIERQVTPNLTIGVTYTGNTGHRLLVIEEANPGDPALCLSLSQPNQVAPGTLTCGPTLESSVFTRPDGTIVNGTRGPLGPNFGSNALQTTIGHSNYNALMLNSHYISKRLELIAAYTYSKSLDESSNLGEEVNPINPALSYALSSFDLKNNFVVSYNYELPFDQISHVRNRLTTDWQLSGITRFSTGFPVTLLNNSDNSLLGTLDNGINNFFIDTPQTTGAPLALSHHPQNNNIVFFNPEALDFQPIGTPGNTKRRYFYGPGQENFDMALAKTVPIHETVSVQVRFEVFNTFNHAQFFGPSAINGVLGSSNFGSVVSAAPPRIGQAAVRVSF